KAAKRIEQLYSRRANRRHQGAARRISALAYATGRADYATAERLASEAVALISQAGNRYDVMATLIDLSAWQGTQGKNREANRTDEQVLELAREIGAPLPLSVAFGNRVVGAHGLGEYERALDMGREALKYARQAASPLREAISLLRQADVFNDIGLALQSAELYGQAISILTQIENAEWLRYACVQTSVLHRRRGGAGLAHEWLRRALVLDESKEAPPEVRIQLAALEIQPAPEQAIETIRGLRKRRAQRLDASDLTLAHYFQACAELRQGYQEKALGSLREAVAHAGSHGTEQAIAAEMRLDEEMQAFATKHFGSDPSFLVILGRMELMEALERRYEVDQEQEPAGLRIELKALGTSLIAVNGKEPRELKPLSREILFYLIDRERVRRDELMDLFWPEQLPGRQVTSLHTAIYGIRNILGKDAVLFDGEVYRIDPAIAVEYDVAKFENATLVAQRLPPGDPRLMFALTEAVRTYGGEFHPELDKAWVDERRRSLELRYLDILASYSEEALVRDRPSEAVNLLREALSLDPLRDDTNRFYLEALGRLGRRSEIVAHYQEYVRLLSQELGLDPPEDLRDLYDRLIS
ncbi:MAG: BTAD domain-containing putative transcriptional regulator, partial [Chloroflexota bacterium]